jgi:hypothetical protein
MSLPIARPFKVEVIYVPYDIFQEQNEDGKIYPKKMQVFNIILDKDSKI